MAVICAYQRLGVQRTVLAHKVDNRASVLLVIRPLGRLIFFLRVLTEIPRVPAHKIGVQPAAKLAQRGHGFIQYKQISAAAGFENAEPE